MQFDIQDDLHFVVVVVAVVAVVHHGVHVQQVCFRGSKGLVSDAVDKDAYLIPGLLSALDV